MGYDVCSEFHIEQKILLTNGKKERTVFNLVEIESPLHYINSPADAGILLINWFKPRDILDPL